MDRQSTYGQYLSQVGMRYNKLSEDEKAYLTYKNMVRVLENDWLKDLEKE